MLETCNSCGTVFDIDENILSKKIRWLRCSVCNEKWSVSSIVNKKSDKSITKDKKNLVSKNVMFKNKSEQVKHELASIKSAVENKTKHMSPKYNPVLEQKNKSVSEIASELSASKVKKDSPIEVKQKNKVKNINPSTKENFIPFILLLIIGLFSALLFFRSVLLSYSFLYFPKYTKNYEYKLNELLNYIKLPIFADLNHVKMIDFVATFQNEQVKFVGTIKNTSNRPILVPKVKILAIREDRKIILEKVLTLKNKIIVPLAEIKFSEILEIQTKKENISVKATLLKKIYDL
ncbi:zinc-ribbon domain-containing protein [Alphaproteobacteria bacterium]|nr:zinc-ribbon domain-containing protein [Alphaproteobacteria bacterium]